MSDHTILLLTLLLNAVVGIVVTLDFAIKEYRHLAGRMAAAPPAPGNWQVLALLAAFLFGVLAVIVYPKLSEPTPLTPFTAAWLTKERQDAFKLAAGSIINASGNFAPTKIETIAEPQSGDFAVAIRDMFIRTGLPIQDAAPGNPIGVPKDHRLSKGITIIAPVPSLAAETVRVGFERIGVQTQRSTDKSRTGYYLIVEVGPEP
jgi:hypothetical protein